MRKSTNNRKGESVVKKDDGSRSSKKSSQEEIKDLTGLLQRLQAEFNNYKRRVDEEKKTYSVLAKKNFVEKLIPIIDHFELALRHECMDKNYEMGMKMIHGLLIDMLVSEHISILDPLDQKFDPNTHEVISTSYVSDKEEDVVLDVQQKGYLLGGKVIRSARVVINKKAEEIGKVIEKENDDGMDSTSDENSLNETGDEKNDESDSYKDEEIEVKKNDYVEEKSGESVENKSNDKK